MRSGTIALLAGVVAAQCLPVLPAPVWLVPLAILLVALWRCRGLRPVAVVLAGFLWAVLHAQWLRPPVLPAALQGQDLLVTGVILSLPEPTSRGIRFEFRAARLVTPEGVVVARSQHLRLAWYGQPPALRAGEGWQLSVRLKRPHGLSNPGGFDYERYLFQRGIQATGYLRKSPANMRLPEYDQPAPVARLRAWLRAALQAQLSDPTASAIITALVIGDRSGMTAAHWRVLAATGTGHLVAISGLHIGLVAGLVFWLTRRVWGWLPFAGQRLTPIRVAALCALAAATLYAALAGFSVPTRRALIMLIVIYAALCSNHHTTPGRAWSLALVAVLLLDPLAVLSAGFWLSFLAVGVILVTLHGRQARRRGWTFLALQRAVTLGLMPVTLLWFGQVSLSSLLVNLVAIPVFSLVVVPLSLLAALAVLAAPAVAGVVCALAAASVALMWQLFAAAAAFEYAIWTPPALPLTILALLGVGVGVLLLPAGVPARWTGIVMLLPAVFYTAPRPAEGTAWIDVLDVGQGLSVVVRTAGHTLVFDAGPASAGGFDAGERVVAPFLRQAGIHHIDSLLISHGDNDHIGGAPALSQALSVGAVLTSVPERFSGADVFPCLAGNAWRWEGVGFRILHPSRLAPQGGNNHSCVLRIDNGSAAALLTGDIEQAAEWELVHSQREQLAADLLVVPHHGSKTSSMPDFVSAVSPAVAVVSSGYHNRFGFPRPVIVARYEALGARVVNTALAGALHFRLGPDGLQATAAGNRHRQRRYWQADSE